MNIQAKVLSQFNQGKRVMGGPIGMSIFLSDYEKQKNQSIDWLCK